MANNEKCLEQQQDGEINFKSSESLLNGLLKLFKVPNSKSQTLPTPLILATSARPGLSPSKISARIIQRKSEAGIPVGPLEGGGTAPDEIMEKIRVEEMVNALTTESRIDVAIQPGTALQATGANAGGPVSSFGTIVGIASGNGQMS
jgi:hypothetical protein